MVAFVMELSRDEREGLRMSEEASVRTVPVSELA
jgi:hypothetical protein